METLFENRHIRDKASIEEMYTNTLLKRPIMYFLYAIEGVCVLLNILNVIIFGSVDFTPTVIALAIAVTVFVMLKIMTSKVTKQIYELNGGEPPELTTYVYEDRIKVFTEKNENELEWSKFKAVQLTKNLILLRTRENVVFALSRAGFTKGTYQGFCEFLRKKGLLK